MCATDGKRIETTAIGADAGAARTALNRATLGGTSCFRFTTFDMGIKLEEIKGEFKKRVDDCCPRCSGQGTIKGEQHWETCPNCNGSGARATCNVCRDGADLIYGQGCTVCGRLPRRDIVGVASATTTGVPEPARTTSMEGLRADTNPVTDEIEQLHKPIAKWLRERDWPFFYSNPTKRTGRTLGEPDFIVMCPNSKVMWLECKTTTGQLTKEQSALRARAAELGHFIYIVRSMDEFAEAIFRACELR